MHALSDFLHSLTLRFTFCSQGEHKRETIETDCGQLRRRCLDCGHAAALGTVHATGSNRLMRTSEQAKPGRSARAA
jgi:hypothetical protein